MFFLHYIIKMCAKNVVQFDKHIYIYWQKTKCQSWHKINPIWNTNITTKNLTTKKFDHRCAFLSFMLINHWKKLIMESIKIKNFNFWNIFLICCSSFLCQKSVSLIFILTTICFYFALNFLHKKLNWFADLNITKRLHVFY